MDNPIRILQVGMSPVRGGIESLIYDIYCSIDKNKVQFDFLVPPGIDIAFKDEIKSMGGRIYEELLPIGLNPINYYKHFYALDNFFLNHKEIKGFHLNTSGLTLLYGIQQAKKHGVPVRIIHSHNSNNVKKKNFIFRLLDIIHSHTYIFYVTDLFACSKLAGEWLFNDKPFQIIKNGIQVEKFKYNTIIRNKYRELNNWQDKTIVGHIGRFCEQKNHKFLISVFHEYHKYNENAILLLIGVGPLTNKIKSLVTSLGLDNCVYFLGNRNDVHILLQIIDIFLFPSLYEGLSVVAIEAQAAGLPCLVSDRLSVETKILDKFQMISLEKGPIEWSKAMINLMKSHSRMDSSQKIKEAGFDIRDVAKKLESYYIRAVKK